MPSRTKKSNATNWCDFMPKIHIICMIFERIDFNNLQSISSAKRNNGMRMNKSLCDTNEIVLRGDNIILQIYAENINFIWNVWALESSTDKVSISYYYALYCMLPMPHVHELRKKRESTTRVGKNRAMWRRDRKRDRDRESRRKQISHTKTI